MSSRRDRVLHLQVETGEMYGVFSPDRSRLLTAGDGVNPKVQIWDVETGNCFRVLNGHKEPVAALAWAEDAAVYGMPTIGSVNTWHRKVRNEYLRRRATDLEKPAPGS